MSVWPDVTAPEFPALRGSEGELVSISVTVEPRDLEDLLEALATLDSPINPLIYHGASVIYVGRDGAERVEPSTMVEFPAYAGWLPKIRAALTTCGFSDAAVSVSSMLDEIHGREHTQAAPAGADFAYRILRKHQGAAAAGSH
jgi:hypothetical protein